MDVRSTYLAAAEALAGQVDSVGDDTWTAPGLGVWDVRALVGHTSRALTTVLEYLNRPADRIDCPTAADYFATVLGRASERLHADVAERGFAAGAALGPDPAATVREHLRAVRDTLADAGDPVILTIGGGMRLSVYLETRVFELTVHALDLADALSTTVELPPPALELTIATLARIAVRTNRAPAAIQVLTGRGSTSFSLLGPPP